MIRLNSARYILTLIYTHQAYTKIRHDDHRQCIMDEKKGLHKNKTWWSQTVHHGWMCILKGSPVFPARDSNGIEFLTLTTMYAYFPCEQMLHLTTHGTPIIFHTSTFHACTLVDVCQIKSDLIWSRHPLLVALADVCQKNMDPCVQLLKLWYKRKMVYIAYIKSWWKPASMFCLASCNNGRAINVFHHMLLLQKTNSASFAVLQQRKNKSSRRHAAGSPCTHRSTKKRTLRSKDGCTCPAVANWRYCCPLSYTRKYIT